jgi:hypothetical protein
LHLFTLKSREPTVDELILRIQHIFEDDHSGNFVGTESMEINFQNLFKPKYYVALQKEVGLALNSEFSKKKKKRFFFPTNENRILPGLGEFVPVPKIAGDKQNSGKEKKKNFFNFFSNFFFFLCEDEEGVFLSKIALENAKKKG